MQNKKYTHLFFDLDNTLWDFNRNSYFAMQAAFKRFPEEYSSIDFEDFYETYSYYNNLLWSDYRKQLVSKNDLTRLRFQKTFDKMGVNRVNAEEMNSAYLDEMPKQLFLVKDALPVLEYLKSKKYQLNIISNGFTEIQYQKLKNTGLSKFFNKVFLSSEVKIPKPGLKIFEYAIKSVNARKNSSLMIGDDWEVDICGAKKFGIDAVYFNPKQNGFEHVREAQNARINVFCIYKLSQLTSLL